jgi:hypothetical protein
VTADESVVDTPGNLGSYVLVIGMVSIAFASVFRFTFSAEIGQFLLAAVAVVGIVSLTIVLALYTL